MLRRPAPGKVPEIHVDIGRQEHRVVVKSDKVSSGESRGTAGSGCDTTSSFGSGSVGGIGPEVSHLGWGRWYTLRELEDATGGLCPENVLGEGGYGIVYHGVLTDGTKVAVKNLLNNKYVFFFRFFISVSYLCYLCFCLCTLNKKHVSMFVSVI